MDLIAGASCLPGGCSCVPMSTLRETEGHAAAPSAGGRSAGGRGSPLKGALVSGLPSQLGTGALSMTRGLARRPRVTDPAGRGPSPYNAVSL